MARSRALLLLALSALAPAASAYTCTDDDGCERLGSCNSGACVCDRGFAGPSCGALNLAPAKAESFVQWPSPASRTAGTSSSWGYTTVFDPSDGLWHAFICVACGASGVVGDGGGQSWVAHVASSTGPDEGYDLVAMVTPQTSFGPHVAVAPDGTFVHVFRVNVLNETALCGGNGTDPLPESFRAAAYINDTQVVSGDPESGTSIYIAWAERMVGPWQVVRTNITGAGDVHKSNPAIWPLAVPIPYTRGDGSRGNASWGMAYRWNPKGGEQNAVALADTFLGPWQNTYNISTGKGNSEDPFLWQQPGPQAGAGLGHVLFHNGPYGFHSWGPLDGSSPWHLSPTGAYAFTLNVSVDDGSVVPLRRRERPELRFRPDGTPAMLYNGVVGPDGSAFSMGQPLH